jgi:hypothetical protein
MTSSSKQKTAWWPVPFRLARRVGGGRAGRGALLAAAGAGLLMTGAIPAAAGPLPRMRPG